MQLFVGPRRESTPPIVPLLWKEVLQMAQGDQQKNKEYFTSNGSTKLSRESGEKKTKCG
jgi:hypothetical protein